MSSERKATDGMTVRQAARNRHPLDGADAQALERALTATERERDALQRHFDAAGDGLNLAALLDLYWSREQEALARAEKAEAALLALLVRYERDSGEGDGIPEDAVEYDAAARLLMPRPVDCDCCGWAGPIPVTDEHNKHCAWYRRAQALALGQGAPHA